jgi:hypothetical protein
MEKVNRLDMYYSLENKEIHSKFWLESPPYRLMSVNH